MCFLACLFTLNSLTAWISVRWEHRAALAGVYIHRSLVYFLPVFPTHVWQIPKLKPVCLRGEHLLVLSNPHHDFGWCSAKSISSILGTVGLFVFFNNQDPRWVRVQVTVNGLSNITQCPEMVYGLLSVFKEVVLIGKNMHFGALTHGLSSRKCLVQEAHAVPRPAAYSSQSWPQEDRANTKAPNVVQACAKSPTCIISFNFTKRYNMGSLSHPILQTMGARVKVICPAS